MKSSAFFVLALAASSTALLHSGCARAEAQTLPSAVGGVARSSLELVVYSGDFAMVRERRSVDLQPGRTHVGLLGVSQSLDQNSVIFDWPKTKDARVVSSTYDLGTSNSGHLLERFLGRTVDLVYRGQDGQPGERVTGTLEVADPGNVVVKADGKYIVNPPATIEAPADQGVVTIPQLSADVDSKSGGKTDLDVGYMTGGLSWSADYTMTLQPDRDAMGLECWATVTNKTGTDYPDAQISFVAGSPNRAVSESRARLGFGVQVQDGRFEQKRVGGAAMNGAFEAPVAVGELYAYPYKSTATIRQDQMNRVRMMGSDGVAIRRSYTIAVPEMNAWENDVSGNADQRLGATLSVGFYNKKEGGLGLPLPGGTIRVYEPDKTGAVRYVGAATIGDTPKDAHVSLPLAQAFDVYAQARQVSSSQLDKRHVRRTMEVTLHNEKAKAVTVDVSQSLGTPWRMTDESAKSRKASATLATWSVPVPAGGTTKLRYTVTFGP